MRKIFPILILLILSSCGMQHQNFNKQKFTNLSTNKVKVSPVEIKKEKITNHTDAIVDPAASSFIQTEVTPLSNCSQDETISFPEEKETIQEELNGQAELITTPVIVQESYHPKRELLEKAKPSIKKLQRRGAGTMAALLIAGIFLLIAGLTFLLIGAVLALISGGLGTVFLIIGGVLIVLALVMIILGASS